MISPFVNESKQSARAHLYLVKYVLQLFGKSITNVVALSGDNFSTNMTFVSLSHVGFIG